jgi:hypothetical protein
VPRDPARLLPEAPGDPRTDQDRLPTSRSLPRQAVSLERLRARVAYDDQCSPVRSGTPVVAARRRAEQGDARRLSCGSVPIRPMSTVGRATDAFNDARRAALMPLGRGRGSARSGPARPAGAFSYGTRDGARRYGGVRPGVTAALTRVRAGACAEDRSRSSARTPRGGRARFLRSPRQRTRAPSPPRLSPISSSGVKRERRHAAGPLSVPTAYNVQAPGAGGCGGGLDALVAERLDAGGWALASVSGLRETAWGQTSGVVDRWSGTTAAPPKRGRDRCVICCRGFTCRCP